MRTIWKYNLKPGETKLKLPLRHLFLHAGIDHAAGGVAVWVLLDDDDESDEVVRVRIKGTGHDCDDVKVWPYLGTVHQTIHHSLNGFEHDEQLVWHVFVEPTASWAYRG